MKPVRFGVVGVGGMGRAHVREIMELEEAELIAGADIQAEARANFQATHGLECYDSPDELLTRKEIEAVCVVIPHPFHRQVTVEALHKKKHVLVEKPIAGAVMDADPMIAAAKETGRKLGVVFQQRTRPDIREAAKLIHSGQLGELLRASMIAPQFRTQAYYERGTGWRGTWKGEQGGVLLNQAPHPLDLFIWLAGMPVRVTGLTSTRIHRIETEDTASALLEYPNGAHGVIQANTTEAPSSICIEVACTRGKIVIRDSLVQVAMPATPLDEYILNADDDFGRLEVKWKDLKAEGPTGHGETIRDFALAVREDRPPMVPGEEGLKSLELANAVVLSSERQQTVTLPLDREDYAQLLREKTGEDAV